MTGILFLPLLFSAINCEVPKISLTFVIDDTGSMSKEIAQVKESANAIFDTVLNSKASPIENFILVTFNDPDVRPAIITRDRDTFKRALNNIEVDGGGECPEYSMSGIESGLKESLPRSQLYVFTDASACDYKKFEEVKSLAQKKSSKIVFVLTGRCYSYEQKPDEIVYYDLATATSGQVFNLGKTDVSVILDYVKESVKGISTVLHTGTYSPGYGHKINVTADGHLRDVIIISASGDKPKIEDVTDPKGGKPDTKTVVDLDKITIVKVPDPKPGVYTAKVGSASDTTVVVTGMTTIDFQHGFSTFKPTSIKDTSTRPRPGINSYLTIKLDIVEGGEVKLTHVEISDIDGKSILEEPLEELNEKERIYVTEPIKTPNIMFRITVFGYAVADNTTVKRISPTSIEPQKPDLEKKEIRAPKVNIEGATKISVVYNAPIKLSCKVNAYPKPDVIWLENSSGSLLPCTVADVEPPYEYISILDVDEVNKNTTYTCKASNAHGEDSTNIEVEIPSYFNVMESPKDSIVKYNTAGKFLCKIKASPPANITWYRNGYDLRENEKFSISPDGSLLIPHMDPNLQGDYSCHASNGFQTMTFKFKVVISGVEAPKIDKHVNKVSVAKGSDPDLICRITAGIPSPRFKWYFKRNSHDAFTKLTGIDSNKINFKDITTGKSGVYKCMTFNAIGHDVHDIELVVEYPPTIKKSESNVSGQAGEELILRCQVDSVPAASIMWTRNGANIRNTPTTQIYRDHSLKLKLSVKDTGTYKCAASNRLGKAMKQINLEVHIPAHIEPPRESPLSIKVGDDINLPCIADGVPKPELKWIFYKKDEKTETKLMKKAESSSFLFPRAQVEQEGYYTCIATNAGGSYNITYEVRVNAPPNIVNEYKDKTFRPIEGDVVLMIKCHATGSPKPEITWTKDGFNIAAGTPWYDIDQYGTLFIKNIDTDSTGTYVCRADNILGRDSEMYYVIADPYPLDATPGSTLLVERGTSVQVNCNVPHDITGSIRWYKYRTLILHGDFTINYAKLSDSGLYVCRVSNFLNSRSEYTRVIVGFKPNFDSTEEENVELADGNPVELICTNEAEPPAKMTWWHNGVMLNITRPYHFFYKTARDHGNYTCAASNEFGTIKRTFYMRSIDCLLSVKDDFTKNQPIMFSSVDSSLSWPRYEIVDGNMIIPRDDYVYLFCPSGFTDFTSTYITAFCNGENDFKVRGTSYKYADLKCNSEVEPNIYTTGDECFGDGTEMINIRFKVTDRFLEAYRVCYDKHNKMPLYTKHTLNRHLADVEPKSQHWLSSDLWPLDSDKLYDCNIQVIKMSIVLGKWFHADNRCCFSRRQLISPRDMMPGLLQSSTYTYLNVVPHWSTCNTNNWDDVEQQLRDLAKSINYPLNVWTGVAKKLKLSTGSSTKTDISIDDTKGQSQPVPRYLWKLIQDPVTSKSLAIVQVNVPDLKDSEVSDYVLCEDICEHIPWLSSRQFHNVSQGYTYCCKIKDFEKVFGFEGVFNGTYVGELDEVLSIADSLVI